MTKVTMPEPVMRIYAEGGIRTVTEWRDGARDLPDGDHDLITTTQAEAYANARVREALEEAIAAVESCRTTGTIRHGTVSDCIEAIRALLPSTPARPESEQ